MSGGYWEYRNDSAAFEIFGETIARPYSKNHEEQRKRIIEENCLEDKKLTEITYDVFQMLLLFDLMKSGDIMDETYELYRDEFLKKWEKRRSDNNA